MKHYYLFVPLLLAACHETHPTKQSAPEVVQDSAGHRLLPSPPEVIAYQQALEKLDTTDMKNTVVAADMFDQAFTGKDPALCDVAYVVYYGFYEKIFSSVAEHFTEDTIIGNNACIGVEDTAAVAVKYINAYEKNIRQYGFRITCSEGTPFLGEEGDFFGKRFYKHLSKEMKAYLEQINRENKSPFEEDAGILLSPQDFVERLAWWDAFIEKYPKFLLLEEARLQRRTYLTYFLQGMDNTRLLADDGKSLDPYFEDAYTYLGLHYPKTYSNSIVKPVLEAYKANNPEKAGKLVMEYVSKNEIEFNETYRYK
ncbi:hypothetical protein [Chitinophaga sp. Cy-1792]|uniref:hypothetical protein n=1 Tax=Chitinophaga sp. Cy-1792 TaxID=2608339 RepID=UPI00141F6BA0|nr:hypothetical protein [Chitinophaga sp. Cy-1792]NIG55462.1 hypothetical protein [Chitinophaga sp. Cy-1792]